VVKENVIHILNSAAQKIRSSTMQI